MSMRNFDVAVMAVLRQAPRRGKMQISTYTILFY